MANPQYFYIARMTSHRYCHFVLHELKNYTCILLWHFCARISLLLKGNSLMTSYLWDRIGSFVMSCIKCRVCVTEWKEWVWQKWYLCDVINKCPLSSRIFKWLIMVKDLLRIFQRVFKDLLRIFQEFFKGWNQSAAKLLTKL